MANLVNHARFEWVAEHPDMDYLKQDDLGGVLSDALAELYRVQPEHPLTFLGNWLVNYSSSTDNLKIEQMHQEERTELQAEFLKQQAALVEQQKIQDKAHEDLRNQEIALKSELETTRDVEAYLAQLATQLERTTQATGVYIGLYEQVKKPISDLDDERAHIENDAPYVIRYIEATPSSQNLLDTVLKEDEGEVTYSVWKEDPEEEDKKSEHGDETARPEKAESLKIAFVPDVINDPRIKFFDVPKLGCYLVIPLTYKSCLSENAFDLGVENAVECRRLRVERQQELERLAQAAAEAAEAAENKEEVPEEEEAKEAPQLPEIVEAPYSTQDVKLVICLDSLGQDRVFSEDQVKACCGWVKFFSEQWERAEASSMRHDVEAFIDQREADSQKYTEKEGEWAEEEKNTAEEAESQADEKNKPTAAYSALFNLLRKRVLDQFNNLCRFKEFCVVKFPQVFKVAFLYVGIPKEEIFEPGTNMISWKIAKKHLGENFKETLQKLEPKGPKPDPVPVYAKTMHLSRELEKISLEEVKQYSLAMAQLYRLLETAFKLRIADVTQRRKAHLARNEAREQALKTAKDLENKRKKALEEAMDKHKADMEQVEEAQREPFDQAGFLADFDERESNKAIEIPPEVAPDEDLDLDWEETNP